MTQEVKRGGIPVRMANEARSARETVRSVAGATQTERQALGRPATSPWTTLRDEKQTLTDGWNYVKVVVGSNLHAEVRMRSSHSFWAKDQEANEVIDLCGLFSDYWSSINRDFTILSQSITTKQSAQL